MSPFLAPPDWPTLSIPFASFVFLPIFSILPFVKLYRLPYWIHKINTLIKVPPDCSTQIYKTVGCCWEHTDSPSHLPPLTLPSVEAMGTAFLPWRTILSRLRASLVAQWLRIRLPMQGTWVRALVREDPTCHGATKPMHHNYWACALEPASHNYWSPRA